MTYKNRTLIFSFIVLCNVAIAQKLDWEISLGKGDNSYFEHSSIVRDSKGYLYVSGPLKENVDFDPSDNTVNLGPEGKGTETFVAKYDSAGRYQWVFKITSVNEKSQNFGTVMTIDASDNIYVAGYFSGTIDFDPNGIQLLSSTYRDGFIVKYNSSGIYQWGSKTDVEPFISPIRGIAVDKSGNVYITGPLHHSCWYDIFIAKYTALGVKEWAFKIEDGQSSGIAVDDFGNIYVTGYFDCTTDFDPSENTAKLVGFDSICSRACYSSSKEIFVAKYNSSGAYQWAFAASNAKWNPFESSGNAIVLSHSGDIYITGYFFGKVDFDPGPEEHVLVSDKVVTRAEHNAFIAKYTSSGKYQWATRIPGIEGSAVALDKSENIFVTGILYSDKLTENGYTKLNGYVAKYDPDGNQIKLFKEKIGSRLDFPSMYNSGVLTDDFNNLYVTGGASDDTYEQFPRTKEKTVFVAKYKLPQDKKNKPAIKDTIALVKSFDKTKVLTVDTLIIPSKEITVSVWDDQSEDGDIVTLFLNGLPVLEKYTLKNKVKEIQLVCGSGKNELVMYAENMGSSPPNTAAVKIKCEGKLIKQLVLKSTEKTSESIVIQLD